MIAINSSISRSGPILFFGHFFELKKVKRNWLRHCDPNPSVNENNKTHYFEKRRKWAEEKNHTKTDIIFLFLQNSKNRQYCIICWKKIINNKRTKKISHKNPSLTSKPLYQANKTISFINDDRHHHLLWQPQKNLHIMIIIFSRPSNQSNPKITQLSV